MPEEEKITKFVPLYGSASVFGPFTGGMFGGFLVSLVGGYENKRSALFLAGFAVVTLLSSFIVIYSDSAVFSGKSFCITGKLTVFENRNALIKDIESEKELAVL